MRTGEVGTRIFNLLQKIEPAPSPQREIEKGPVGGGVSHTAFMVSGASEACAIDAWGNSSARTCAMPIRTSGWSSTTKTFIVKTSRLRS